LDLLDTFRQYPDPTESLRVSVGDWHPNAQGHRLMAEAVLKTITEISEQKKE